MEKAKLQKQKTHTKKSNPNKPTLIWDCGSSLYDSFELKSFERQLSSALVSRTLSMPHLSEPGSKKPKQQPTSSSSMNSNISRSIRRIVRSIFKPMIRDDDDGVLKLAGNDGDDIMENKSRAGPNAVYDEFNKFNSTKRSMKSSNVVMRRTGSVADATRRAASAPTSLGISCA